MDELENLKQLLSSDDYRELGVELGLSLYSIEEIAKLIYDVSEFYNDTIIYLGEYEFYWKYSRRRQHDIITISRGIIQLKVMHSYNSEHIVTMLIELIKLYKND
jgi:hypothetical protein